MDSLQGGLGGAIEERGWLFWDHSEWFKPVLLHQDHSRMSKRHQEPALVFRELKSKCCFVLTVSSV